MTSQPTITTSKPSFTLPLATVLVIGGGLSIGFYSLIRLGPLSFDVLHRYCLGHPVAIASVTLFFVGMTSLFYKWQAVVNQSSLASRMCTALRRLITDGEEVPPNQRASWMQANFVELPSRLQASWLGQRVARVLDLQIQRGRRAAVERDLESLSGQDADAQHESHALLRIINWAMPMLGFLGTVLGISKTLGGLDTQLLATEQQAAMDQLTDGLFVAFDTTAIALVLTVISMFVQFGINRLELKLLGRIDRNSSDTLIGFMGVDPTDSHATLLAPVKEMAADLVAAVNTLIETQTALWGRTIVEAQGQWQKWSDATAEQTEKDIGAALKLAFKSHTEQLQKVYDDVNRQADSRAQQWQRTLSDQARLAQAHQKEICKQSEEIHDQTLAIRELVSQTTDLKKLEVSIADNLRQLEDVGRIEKATLCVGEAVAVLATSLERAGVFRQPVKPRPKRTDATDSAKTKTGDSASLGGVQPTQQPHEARSDNPAQRKAA